MSQTKVQQNQDLRMATGASIIIRGGTLQGDDFLDTDGIVDGAVTTDKLADDAVDGSKLADDSVDSEHIVDGSIDTVHLADDAVTPGKVDSTEDYAVNSLTATALASTEALTIADGVITPTIATGTIVLTPEGGANDDLTSIAGTHPTGTRYLLDNQSAYTITVKALQVDGTPTDTALPPGYTCGVIRSATGWALDHAVHSAAARDTLPDKYPYWVPPYWDDLVVPATLVNLTGPAAPPAYNETDATVDFSASASNTVQFAYQMPHGWDGTDVHFHIHAFPSNTDDGDVVWEWKYRWVPMGTVAGAWDTTSAAEAMSGVEDKHTYMAAKTIPAAGTEGLSAILQVQLQRLGNDVDDTFTGLVQMMSADVHYRRNTPGSRQEYVK